MKRLIKLELAYDGSTFLGMQRQKEFSPTVQGFIEEVLFDLYQTSISITYAGRTDRGVHAQKQIVCYEDEGKIPLDKLSQILEKKFGENLQVVALDVLSKKLDPRRDAIARTYEYWLYEGNRSVFLDKFMLNVKKVNQASIQSCLDMLMGDHDFKSFCKGHEEYFTTYRCIMRADILPNSQNFLGFTTQAWVITLVGDSFLRHMVRKIVGLILEVNQNIITPSDFKNIFENIEEHKWEMAKSNGLFLKDVEYEKER